MAIELLLKLAGVDGEAEREGYAQQIQLDSFDWSFHNPSSPTGAGAGAGKVEAHGITCTKRVDKSSPKLFQAITTGKHFPNAVLTALKAGGDKAVDYMKLEFDQLFLVDLHESGSSGDNDVPRESINFAFGKVTVTYSQQTEQGNKGNAIIASYDFKKHVAG
jgi:type VI secretion system secreted protein Hcp